MKPILQLSRRTLFSLGILGAANAIMPTAAVAQQAIEPLKSTTFPPNTPTVPYIFLNHSNREVEDFLDALAAKEAAEIIKHAHETVSSSVLAKGKPYYETVYGSTVTSESGYRRITTRGYAFSTGGTLYFELSGGANISIGFSIPASFGGSISVSVSFGRQVSSPGIGVTIPGGNIPYGVELNNTYSTKPYTVYYIDAYGNRSVYAHMHTTPVLTYHHFRTVRV